RWRRNARVPGSAGLCPRAPPRRSRRPFLMLLEGEGQFVPAFFSSSRVRHELLRGAARTIAELAEGLLNPPSYPRASRRESAGRTSAERGGGSGRRSGPRSRGPRRKG